MLVLTSSCKLVHMQKFDTYERIFLENSSAGIATDYGLDGRRAWVRVPVE
jgi:hypothetical protein